MFAHSLIFTTLYILFVTSVPRMCWLLFLITSKYKRDSKECVLLLQLQ